MSATGQKSTGAKKPVRAKTVSAAVARDAARAMSEKPKTRPLRTTSVRFPPAISPSRSGISTLVMKTSP